MTLDLRFMKPPPPPTPPQGHQGIYFPQQVLGASETENKY